MPKVRVAVLFGGRSGEHEVSLVSGAAVMSALNGSRFEVVPIGITRAGVWRMGQPGWHPERVLSRGRRLAWPAQPNTWPGEPIDVVFPVLHGPWGEDGTIQGFLELAAVPYVGSGVLGSAASMDKEVMKRLFLQAGLPVVPYQTLDRMEWVENPKRFELRLERRLSYPMFVKPANLGSSVGISKVHDRTELHPALKTAAEYDNKIVIEQGVEGRELECGVLGNRHPEASVPGEVIPGREFYTYEAKYGDAGSKTVVPAELGRRHSLRVRQMAIEAFRATECRGLARVDFFLEAGTDRLYVNEINTMPGFTPISMYAKMWDATGIAFPALVERLVRLALEWDRQQPARR